MKWGQEHIGGVETGVVRFRFYGDEEAGMALVKTGRELLGEFKRYVQNNATTDMNYHRDFRLNDGSTIRTKTVLGSNGYHDQDEIWINVPPVPKKKGGPDKIIGFVAHLKDAATAGNNLILKNPKDLDEEFMFVVWGTYEPNVMARDKLLLVPGEIADTLDESQVLPNTNLPGRGWHFYYWDGTYHSTEVGGWGPVELGELLSPDNGSPNYIPFSKVDLPPNGTNVAFTAEAGMAPVESARNSRKHIAMSAKPKKIGRGRIVCEDTNNDAFIAVIPGKASYNFDDPTFDEEKYGYTTEFDITLAYLIITGDIPTLGITGFPGAPTDRDSGVLGTHHISQAVIPRDLVVTDAEVKEGRYYLVGKGSFDVHLICESGLIYKMSHEFINSQEQVCVVRVGTEINGDGSDFSKAVQIKEKITVINPGMEPTLVIDLD
jgi:hypothetical protein